MRPESKDCVIDATEKKKRFVVCQHTISVYYCTKTMNRLSNYKLESNI